MLRIFKFPSTAGAPFPKSHLFLFIFSLTFVTSSNANGQTTETLQLTTGEDYPPFVDRKLKDGGLATALVSKVVSLMGFKPNVTVLPWARGYRLTLNGEYTATYPYIKNAEREAEMLFSEPLFSISTHIFVNERSNLKYESLSDLAGRVTCNYVGSALPYSIQNLISSNLITVTEAPNLTTCFKLLDLGRIDFVAVNKLAGVDIICERISSANTFRMSDQAAEVLNLYLIAPSRNPVSKEFLAKFNSELSKFKVTKEYRSLSSSLSIKTGVTRGSRGFNKIECFE